MRRQWSLVYSLLRGHFYAVRIGRRPGIYQTLEEVKSQIFNFPNAEYRKFPSFFRAFEYLQLHYPLNPIGPLQTKLPYLVNSVEDSKEKPKREDRDEREEAEEADMEREDLTKVRKGNVYTLLADGGARESLGLAGSAYVIYSPKGEKIAKGGIALPNNATHNEAEYTALLYGLQKAVILRIPKIRVLMDSQLVIYQVKGKYKTHTPNLIPLYEQVMREIRLFEKFSIAYIPRGRNQEADALASKAMDAAAKVNPSKLN